MVTREVLGLVSGREKEGDRGQARSDIISQKSPAHMLQGGIALKHPLFLYGCFCHSMPWNTALFSFFSCLNTFSMHSHCEATNGYNG